MYIYFICPSGKLESNFIKIGICENPESLKKRYSTYYGTNYKSYYLKISNMYFEKNIQENLKKQGLHIENELFIYNKKYDINFYIQQINKFHDEEMENIIKKLNILSIKNINMNDTNVYDNICNSCEKKLRYCISNDFLDDKSEEEIKSENYKTNPKIKKKLFLLMDTLDDIMSDIYHIECYINKSDKKINVKLIYKNNKMCNVENYGRRIKTRKYNKPINPNSLKNLKNNNSNK
jgi:hypothetical protein